MDRESDVSVILLRDHEIAVIREICGSCFFQGERRLRFPVWWYREVVRA